ncbi:MAG: amino acid adenylation domain-containing protein, partial [Pyrinomonadaceae bacterium]
RCFHKLFEAQAAADPDRTAIICNGKTLTYGELNTRANQLAHHLRELGAKPEILIPICVDRSIEMAVGILGILKSGAAYVPVDPAYPSERIEFMLADTSADFIVTQSRFLQSTAAKKVLLDMDWETISQQPNENPTLTATDENLAYVIYTSGSTGKPKGAMLTHANLYHYVDALQKEFQLTSDDKYLHLASIAFSSSRRHLLFPLAHGASVVVADEEQRMDAPALFKLIKENAVTVFDAVPSFQRHCLNALLEMETAQRTDLLDNNLRLIVSASEPLLSDIPATWMFEFKHPARHVHMIGQTETSGIISINRITKDDAAGAIRPVPVGHPIADTEIRLLNENLQPVAPDEAGEIYVCGDGLGRGYLNRPELNKQKFIELKTGDDSAPKRFCRTGDYARLLPDGRLECLGRQDFQVKIRGNRVELGEIEALLISHTDVLGCSVIGREDDEPGQIRLVAYIVARQKSSRVINDLRSSAKQKLPDYMQPSAFVLLDALPLTPNGKIDRKNLPPPDESAFTADETYIAPRNPAEQIITGIWAGILGFSRIGVNDNFFDLGGHSLLASRAISCLRIAFNAELPLRLMFEAPTVAGFAEKIALYSELANADSINKIISSERLEAIPLSFAQQRLWFLEQMESGSAAYNMSETLRLTGNIDADALRFALENITARHEILRTSFDSIGGQASQKISTETKIDFSVTDLSDFPTEPREEKAIEIASESAARPFNLNRSPLLRLSLIKLNETEHLLVVVFHHIISDGWSVGVFLKELGELYQAKTADIKPMLPLLPIQYADYAQWQQKWLETADYQRQIEFWKENLKDAPALLELPTDYLRPAVQRYRGARIEAFLPAELTDKIKDLSRRESVTPFMTLLSAWQVLLRRYSGQEDLIVGTPIAGRTRTETENLIGFFVNSLPLRGDLSGNPTFTELLRRTKAQALNAYSNQEMPFEKMVEELNPERSLSYAPVFQTMFALQNSTPFRENFADLKSSRVKLANQTAKFDLSLDVFQQKNGLELQLEYDTDLFAKETARQMLGHYRTILEAIAADSEKRLTEIPMLTEREYDQLLFEWNARTTEVPPVCLHQLFEKHAAQTPEAIAAVWKNEQISYGDLNAKANRLARFLQKQGVKPGTVVGIYVERSLEMLVSLLGVLKTGAAYLPLDPNYPAERLQHMTTDAGISILITQESLVSKTLDFASQKVVCIDGDWSAIAAESARNPENAVAPENPAYVIYTSGSTGKSKGVMVTHANVVNAYAAWEDAYALSSLKSHLQMASFSFDVFTGDVTRALCSGAKLVLCPTESLLEPEKLEQLMR